MAAEIIEFPDETRAIESDIVGYLQRHEQKELVRFVAVGSVDDGKSTLIGRLLHDTKGVYEDQLAAVKRATKGEEIDFSLFTDGLKAEREQGITIDVAYRYFSTTSRKFIIADTPGHVQYTRNMATGASTADVAIILLDARLGVLPQSRRHGYIASLLSIQHLIVAVNKMDLVDYDQSVFERLKGDFHRFAAALGFSSVNYVPISARRGDNVVRRSERTPWYSQSGSTLLEYLETLPVQRDRGHEKFRLPVQYVIRPHLDYRAFAGQIASGRVRPGDELVVLPSGRRSRVKAIDTFEGELAEASAPLSIAVRLEDEIDVSRGDVLARPGELPRIERRFEAMLVWLSERAFDPKRSLLLKQTSRMVPARIERVQWRVDLETLDHVPSAKLALNDIARVAVAVARPIFCDAYRDNRATGAFILVDALTNDTVAAGMIEAARDDASGARAGGRVTAEERAARLGQTGAALFLDRGGDRAVADRIERALYERGVIALVADAADLAPEALRELVARTVEAGLAAIVVGAGDAIVEAVGARLGERRVLRGDATSVEQAADALAERCTPDAG